MVQGYGENSRNDWESNKLGDLDGEEKDGWAGQEVHEVVFGDNYGIVAQLLGILGLLFSLPVKLLRGLVLIREIAGQVVAELHKPLSKIVLLTA